MPLPLPNAPDAPETRVYVALNDEPAGYFTFPNVYRPALPALLGRLATHYRLAVLSGDTDAERSRLQALFGEEAALHFRQSPADKLAYIAAERAQGLATAQVSAEMCAQLVDEYTDGEHQPTAEQIRKWGQREKVSVYGPPRSRMYAVSEVLNHVRHAKRKI